MSQTTDHPAISRICPICGRPYYTSYAHPAATCSRPDCKPTRAEPVIPPDHKKPSPVIKPKKPKKPKKEKPDNLELDCP